MSVIREESSLSGTGYWGGGGRLGRVWKCSRYLSGEESEKQRTSLERKSLRGKDCGGGVGEQIGKRRFYSMLHGGPANEVGGKLIDQNAGEKRRKAKSKDCGRARLKSK